MKQIKIKGFEHYYITKDGKVYNSINSKKRKLKQNEYKELKSHIIKSGYNVVVLHNAGVMKPKAYYVHRLIAQAYIPNPENKPEVNHKDGNKQNNHLSNLEWVTKKQNVNHAYSNGLMKSVTKYHNVVTNKKLLNKGLNHYKKYYNVTELKKIWSIKSNLLISRILSENNLGELKDRKYKKVSPYMAEIIKNYIRDIITKKQKKTMSISDYVEYVKKTYNIKFSIHLYYKLKSEVEEELKNG